MINCSFGADDDDDDAEGERELNFTRVNGSSTILQRASGEGLLDADADGTGMRRWGRNVCVSPVTSWEARTHAADDDVFCQTWKTQ